MPSLVRGKDYRLVTYRITGNYVRFAGGNAKKRAIEQGRKPQLQESINKRRKELGI